MPGNMGVIVAVRDGCVTYWSADAQGLYQWVPEEVLGKPPEAVLGDRWLGDARWPGTEGSRPVAVRQGIATHRTKDGREIHVELTAISVSRDHGLPDLLLLARPLAKQLCTVDNRFRFLAEECADGIIVISLKPELKVEYLNPAMAAITGYRRRDFLTDPSLVLRLLHPADRTLAIGSLVQSGSVRFQLTRKDGVPVWVEINRNLICNAAGETVAIEAIVRDITDRKREQEAVENIQRRFLGMISLELKTPIIAIKGAVDSFLSDSRIAESLPQRQLLEIISQQSDRLLGLVDDLLDMSQIEVGALRLERQPTDLKSILEQCRQVAYYSVAPNHNIVMDLPAIVPLVDGDPRRIGQVVVNLLAFIAGSSLPTSSITVQLRVAADHVTVRLHCAGLHIPKDRLPTLFERFREDTEGAGAPSGMRLAIARGIIETHGGRIWAERDQADGGCTISFTLPLAEGGTIPDYGENGKAAAASKSSAPPVILAVDSDRHTLRYLRRLLNEAGFEVLASQDPRCALELVRDEDPNLIITDLRFPCIDGFHLIKSLRKLSAAPIIVLAISSDEKDVVQALTLGADDYIRKPFVPSELLARVQAALRRYRKEEQAARTSLTLGDLHIDFRKRAVTVAGRPVQLTATEYNLFCELANNAGLVLTHEQLLARVWGPDYKGETHLLHSFIYNLRRKLGDRGVDHKYILTEPGVGYRMAKE